MKKSGTKVLHKSKLQPPYYLKF